MLSFRARRGSQGLVGSTARASAVACSLVLQLALSSACGDSNVSDAETDAAGENAGARSSSGGLAGASSGGMATAPDRAGTGGEAGDSGGLSAGDGAGGVGAGGVDAGGPNSGNVPVELVAACAEYAAAWCERYESCVRVQFRSIYGTRERCVERTTLACPALSMVPGTARTASTVEACASDLTRQTCGEWLLVLPSSCAPPGAEADGTRCSTDSQCESAYCHRAEGSCGTCAQLEPEGSACDRAAKNCEQGLWCNAGCPTEQPDCDENTTGHCARRLEQGAPCEATSDCDRALICKGGYCTTPLQLGDPCLFGGGCDLQADLMCVAANDTHTCAQASYAMPGEPCDLSRAIYCLASSACIPSATDPSSGTCGETIADGEACNPGQRCMAPARCQKGICALPTPPVCQ